MAIEFKIPELGENITSGKVASVLVSAGDTVEENQSVLELETDKAVLEVPSEVAGTVKEVKVSEGDEVEVGQIVIIFEEGQEQAEAPAEQTQDKKSAKQEEEGKEQATQPVEETPTPAEETPDSEQPQTTKAAAQTIEFKVPNLGENVDAGSVAKILVSVGDQIKKDNTLLELETDKAVVEVPAEQSGTIKEILIKEGDQVDVGQHILTIETSESAETKTGAQKEEQTKTETEPSKTETESAPAPKKEEPAPAPQSTTKPKQERSDQGKRPLVPAAPSVRRFAREIGLDIVNVPGSGPGGRIGIEDVKVYSKRLHQQRAASDTVLKGVQAEALPDFSKWGEVDRQSMNKVRETTARHLSYAWTTIPHVTQFDKADITNLEALRKQYGPKAEEAGGKLTVTAILLKIIEGALKKFPQFNASIDMQNKEIIYKHYYNIGVAVDTERGLLVPVVKNINTKNIIELSKELRELSKKARDRKLALEDMQGGNFSISNLGGIGGTAFSPVVNAPEVAILGVSRAEMEPVYQDGQFVPRLRMPLALSYDHRLIDGADAARFLRWVCEALEQPFLLSLEG
ncbi:MAG: dihydrolipoyllysine-residue acetyltransferase [Caldithrix sp.]|nr:dihydrolipoyllysine-residue acetyltransferase [Caldithrix sp.]